MTTMANRLTKGLYEDRSRFVLGQLFDLHRFRVNDFCHNAGWFNANGERLGYGDLSTEDIKRISEGLQEGELFIVLNESDVPWTKSERHPGDPTAPGIRYVCEHADLIIAPKRVLRVARYGVATGYSTVDTLTIENVSPMDAYKAITRYAGVTS
jgi:hypothetical protein